MIVPILILAAVALAAYHVIKSRSGTYYNDGILDSNSAYYGAPQADNVDPNSGSTSVLDSIYPPMTTTQRPINASGSLPPVALTANDLLPKNTELNVDQSNIGVGVDPMVGNILGPSVLQGLLTHTGYKKGQGNQDYRSQPAIPLNLTVSPWGNTGSGQVGLWDRKFEIGCGGDGNF